MHGCFHILFIYLKYISLFIIIQFLLQFLILFMEPEYDFCYTEGKPETLVMLKDVRSVSQLLFADPQLNSFVWIGDRDDQQMMNAKQRIQLQLGEFFYFYNSVQSAKRQLLQDRPQWTVLVINIQMFKEGKQLNSIHKVKSTFFYSKTNDFYFKYMRPYAHAYQNQQIDSEDEKYQQQQNEANDWLQNVYTDQKQLTEKLKEYKGTTTGQKVLPNFVFMAYEIRTSHTLVRTMHSMLKQRIDEETASQINNKFKNLIGYLQQFDKNLQGKSIQMDKECFCKALKDGLKTDKQIVSWYTDETFVYKVINSLLRAHRHPAEVFYIQPYIKLLFNTIHKLYIQQSKEIKEKKKIWEFKVYRGGKMNKEQFQMFKNSKGQAIQNLGFFSTTLNIEIAKNFQKKGNTLFQVEVVEYQMGTSQFGFMSMDKWELGKYGEKQVLFNPLNTFQILDAQQPIQREYLIKLRYRLIDSTQKQDFEEKWGKIAELQKQEKYQNECQGNALTNQYYHLQQGEKYWSKYLQLVAQIGKQYKNQLKQINKIPSDQILEKKLSLYNNQKIVLPKRNIKEPIFKVTDGDIYTKIKLNKLKQVYGRWNLIFNLVINKEKSGNILSQVNGEIQSFQAELISLFGNEHPISLKFLDALKYSLDYQSHKKQQGNLFKKIPQKELFEKQPQFMYLNSVTAHRFLHHQKQKQRITKKLNLSNCQLNDKAINEIRQFFTEQIEQLTLDQNKLTQFPYFIYEMKSLRIVSLKDNELRVIESEKNIRENKLQTDQEGQIRQKKQLFKNKNINKKNEQIDKSKTNRNLTSLKSLYLQNNQLSSLPQSLGNLTSLQQLSLNNNQLSSLLQSIGNLTSLKSLYLQNNQLSSLPQSLGNLTSLQQLSLNNNQLSSLLQSICNLTSLKSLYLQNNQLSSLPQSIGNLTSLKSLYLQNNQLSSLPQSLGNLTSLQQLSLNNNQLSSLPQSIGNLTSLKSLYLQNNQLSSLPQSLGNLTSLQQLSLNNNQLSSLLQSIGNLTSLKSLYLQNNQLSSLPQSLGNLTSLQQLSLNNNQLSSLLQSICNLTSLKSLYLQNNQLSSLPQSIGNLTSLKSLYLQNNQLSSLPQSLGNLTSLQQLSLNNNQLSSLPQSIGNLTSLKSLYLQNNQLSSLPQRIGNLTSLKSLYLQNNQLSSLPQSLGNLTSLQQLSLNNNQLSSLPQSIGNLTSLKSLYLQNNQLSSLPQSLGNLTSLQQLSLNNNQLSSLLQSIGNLTSLKSLYLQNNQLSSLPQSIGNLTSLQQLSLNNNQLSSLLQSIGNLTSLKSLYLQNNQLSSLPQSLGNLTSLQQLSLNNNQLSSLLQSIGNLTSLKSLYLQNNQLSSLPQSLGNLTSLQQLSLNNNQLSSLLQSIGNLTSLKSLYLQNNQLSSLPQSIGNLTSLQQLSLNNNQLSSLLQSIGNLTSLKSLYLQNNQLSSLPQSIGNITSLNKLSISNNRLIIIFYSFSHLNKLSDLDLSSNKLSILPDSFHSLTNLRSLSINNNSFHHLSKSISQLTSLQSLNVSNNFFSQLPSIQKLVNLRTLNVSFNPISSSALGLISQKQIKILVDQKQMSVIQSQKFSTKSVLFVVDSQDSIKNSVKLNVD